MMMKFKNNKPTIVALLTIIMATLLQQSTVHSEAPNDLTVIETIAYHIDELGQQHKYVRRTDDGEDGEEGQQGEIIGGFTQATVLPWHIRQLACDSTGANCFSCGATLVKPDIVMTAAHCVATYNTVPTLAILGGLNVDFSTGTNDGTSLSIVSGSLSIHPNYNNNDIGAGYDIAMYKVSSVTNQPITLNTNSGVPTNSQSVYIFGHGLTSNGGSGSNALQGLQTNAVVPCPTTVSSVPDQHVCVLGSSGTGACSGDSGGPMTDATVTSDVNAATQYGLASYVFGPQSAPCASGNPDVYIDVTFFESWIDTYICENSASAPTGCTPAPTPNPTSAAPTQAPFCSCFSESATVEVLVDDGGGRFSGPFTHPKPKPMAMRDLEVGQQIFAGLGEDDKPVYETVYGFAHRDVDRVAEYLQITTTCEENKDESSSTTTGCNGTLDISPIHLIFVRGKKDPVPAGSLVVGDVLIHQSTEQAGTQPARITGIRTIHKRGLYAPLTQDGTVIVDGIHASSYVSAHHLYPKLIDTITQFVSEHTLFHWWMSPYRIFCTHVLPRMCIDDYSEEEGYIWWLVVSRNLAEIFQGFSNLVIAAGLALLLCVCGAFMMLEALLKNPVVWLVQLGSACFFWWKFSSSFPKHPVGKKGEKSSTKKQD